MPFTSRKMALLRQLEFSEEHITTQLVQLDEAELSTALKRQQRKLSAKYHPDRTGGNAELTKKFIESVAAVEELTNSNDVISSLLEGIAPFDYQIPVDCIDHRINEQIDDYFERMLDHFNSLSSKNDQQQFIAENKTLLQFVLWLHQHSAEIRKARDDAFYRAVHTPSLLNTINQNWHKLIIQFFAEENLNDIVYREAIALGNLATILAIRKLLSPIKWFCFIVCSTYDAMTTALGHGLQGIIKDMSMDLAALSSNKYRALPLLAKMIGLIATFVMPILLFPPLVTYMFALPLLARGLFYLANPINQIIRPLSVHFNVAPIFVGIVTAILGLGALTAILLLSSSMIEMLFALTSVVSILSFIASALVLKKLYELSPEVALTLSIVVGSLTLIQFMSVETQPVVQTLADAIIRLLSELSGLGLNVLGYQQLSNIKENLSSLYVSLPLPEQEAPEVVKEVVDEASQKNYWSHTLFNSPVQRNVLKRQEKMSWHSMGLFGHGVKQLEYSEPLVCVPGSIRVCAHET